MSFEKRFLRRPMLLVLASSLSAAAAVSAKAADAAALLDQLTATESTDATPNATVTLIKRLVKRGVLTKEDGEDLLLVAQADAAEAKAQMALAKAALAQAAAAQARARILSGRSHPPRAVASAEADASGGDEETLTDENAPKPAPAHQAIHPRVKAPPIEEETAMASDADDTPAPTPAPKKHKKVVEVPLEESDAVDSAPPAPRVSRRVKPKAVETPEAGADESDSDNIRESAAAPRRTVARAKTQQSREEPSDATASSAEAPPDNDDEIRVTYVPDVVKEQLREEVKQDVMDQARRENWASPRLLPDWILRFRLFGDFRLRYDGEFYPPNNDNTGAFPNFNAINTGAPFDTAGTLFSPQLDVDQNRERFRLRARLGAGVDLGENFTTGIRIASGENDSPVSENQSLGSPYNGQGGNFSKYPVWLDRAFLKYERGGQPDDDLSVTLGRFDNPFFNTSVIWADDLGFDGVVIQDKFSLGEDVTPFITAGAFPVYNTDLNFGTNQSAKFKSNDKWLYGAQIGTTLDVSKDFSAKIGVGYFVFQNIEGKLSTPFVPLTSSDSGDTDDSRPAFAQKGNTYMALRNITASALNNNGQIDQFQYYGLASKFRDLTVTARLDFNHFEPFQVSIIGEYIKNLAFDETDIAKKAVNNLGAATTTGGVGPFEGGSSAWTLNLKIGDAVLDQRWKWNFLMGYRKVDSDSVVDGFCDADFGGGGTNMKGFTINGNVALSSSVWLNLRWFSATQIAGPQYKNDSLQFDVNAKF